MSNTTTAKARAPRARKATQPAPVEAPQPTTEVRLCTCGCGEPVKGKKALFIPGHDARMAGQIGRALVGLDAKAADALIATLPSEALQRKARNIANNHAAKVAKKAAA